MIEKLWVFPSKMVDLSSSLCWKKPGRVAHDLTMETHILICDSSMGIAAWQSSGSLGRGQTQLGEQWSPHFHRCLYGKSLWEALISIIFHIYIHVGLPWDTVSTIFELDFSGFLFPYLHISRGICIHSVYISLWQFCVVDWFPISVIWHIHHGNLPF